MNEIGGHAQNYFDAPGRDQLQAFACPVNVGARASTLLLVKEIEPKFLFEARRHCHQRCDPMRLLGLGLLDALEPACDAGRRG